MAELIPLPYKAKFVVRQHVRLWSFAGIITFAICAAAVSTIAIWANASSAEVARLEADYRSRATMIQTSIDVQKHRDSLADRMKKIQGLREDKILLALLHNVAEGFSELDCLEYLHVDTRGASKSTDAAANAAAATDSDTNHFLVRMSGITQSTGSLAELMTRIGTTNDPTMKVTLESSKREGFLDGQVTRFQLACEKAADKKGS